MSDLVYESFLEEQWRAASQLAEDSDILQLALLAPNRCRALFLCKGFVRQSDGQIVEAASFEVGFWFPADYLRRVDPLEVVTWLSPIWHPNVLPPYACLGPITPGTELVDLIYRCFEVITYSSWASHDPLNGEAAVWARHNQYRFPVDRRALKRRALNLQVIEETTT